MSNAAHFHIDPRLATLLGESYRSSEQALKELIDNAWDADACNVWVELPNEELPNISAYEENITVRDDGTGMTETEVRDTYLRVARGRIHRGELTAAKRRKVKGRKGIGKFAGLVMADTMTIETVARAVVTKLTIHKEQVLTSATDLETVDLPIHSEPISTADTGTTISLQHLSQALSFPDPQKLRELLVLDYGHEEDFCIHVNGQRVRHEDLPGESCSAQATLSTAGQAGLKFTILEKPKSRSAGILVRVGGKAVGKPTFFGLEDDELIPTKALKRIVGEVEVGDALADAVTADWGGFVENNRAFEELRVWITEQVRPEVERVFQKEVNLAKARRQKEINRRLSLMPEHRRDFARRELDSIFSKYWAESDSKIDTMIGLVLDAFEKDEYYLVCEHIEQASHGDILQLAEALEEFGLTDAAVMVQQARRRLQVLDQFDTMVADRNTLESTIHKALEANLWVLGMEYSLISSNKTLKRTVNDYLDKKYHGNRASLRPDLFLGQDPHEHKLLIEFKRPNATVGREAEGQAKTYRDELTPHFGHMRILVVGGTVDAAMSAEYQETDLKFTTYNALISSARSQLEWLLRDLNEA